MNTNQIVWPEKSPIKDEALWEKNKRTIELICSVGEVTKWHNEGKTHSPKTMSLEGVEVRMLEHWGFWMVGDFNLYKYPKTIEDVLIAVAAVKTLQGFEVRVKKD